MLAVVDDTGFGKTKQLLLVAYLHVVPDPRVLCKPALIVPSLINQWVIETRAYWPFFDLVISFEDHNFKLDTGEKTLSYTALEEYPLLDDVPCLRDTSSTQLVLTPKARRVISLTAYDTQKSRRETQFVSS